MLKNVVTVFTFEPSAAVSAQLPSSMGTPAPFPFNLILPSWTGFPCFGTLGCAFPGVNQGPVSHTPVPGAAAGLTGISSKAGALPPGNSHLLLT